MCTHWRIMHPYTLNAKCLHISPGRRTEDGVYTMLSHIILDTPHVHFLHLKFILLKNKWMKNDFLSGWQRWIKSEEGNLSNRESRNVLYTYMVNPRMHVGRHCCCRDEPRPRGWCCGVWSSTGSSTWLVCLAELYGTVKTFSGRVSAALPTSKPRCTPRRLWYKNTNHLTVIVVRDIDNTEIYGEGLWGELKQSF